MRTQLTSQGVVSGYEAEFSSRTERLLLYLVLATGYGFLGFFGWLLTL
jgi:hypothetical protein